MRTVGATIAIARDPRAEILYNPAAMPDRTLRFEIAALLLVLSGLAALTYQVTWVRLLSLSMGSTSASVSTVLTAFFLGMAVGSFVAERLVRGRDPLRVYVGLEAGIALSGVAVLNVNMS